MKVRQEKDGSVNIIMSDEEMDSIKKNNNTFHLNVKKLRNSLKRQPSKLKLKHGYDPKNWEKIMKMHFSSVD